MEYSDCHEEFFCCMFIDKFIKNIFDQFIFPYFTGDNAEATAYFLVEIIGIAGGLFVLFVACLWGFHTFNIQRINTKLSSYKSREDFSRDFDTIIVNLFEQKFSGKIFRHHWFEFKETLIIPDIYDGKEVRPIRNSVRPFDYFSYNDLKWSPRIFSSWPNVFVGVGLLLTFIGLAAAIGEASTGVASNNVAEAQLSLQKVLNAARVKFLTSIAGLGVSIVLGIAIRFAGWDLKNQIYKICEHLERHMLYEFSEPIQQKQLKELQQQTHALKQFTDDFAINLGKELERRLDSLISVSFAQAISPLNEAIQQQLKQADARGSDAVERIVRELGDKIQSGTGEQMTAIVQSLGQVRETLNETATNLSTNLNSSAMSISDQVKDAGEHFNSEMRDVVATMSVSISRFESGVNILDERIKNHAELLDNKIRAVQDTIPNLTSAAHALREATDPIASTAEKFEAISLVIQEVSSDFQHTQAGLIEAANKMGEAQEITSKAWEEYRSRFEDIDENLENTFEQYQKHIKASQEQMQEFTKKLDDSFVKATQGLHSSIGALEDVFEDLASKFPDKKIIND